MADGTCWAGLHAVGGPPLPRAAQAGWGEQTVCSVISAEMQEQQDPLRMLLVILFWMGAGGVCRPLHDLTMVMTMVISKRAC